MAPIGAVKADVDKAASVLLNQAAASAVAVAEAAVSAPAAEPAPVEEPAPAAEAVAPAAAAPPQNVDTWDSVTAQLCW